MPPNASPGRYGGGTRSTNSRGEARGTVTGNVGVGASGRVRSDQERKRDELMEKRRQLAKRDELMASRAAAEKKAADAKLFNDKLAESKRVTAARKSATTRTQRVRDAQTVRRRTPGSAGTPR